jgi:TonB family protein
MTARSPSAFALSALLHAGVAALALLGIFFAHQQKAVPPVIFVVVAGEGNNYGATEAPALGSPDGPLKFNVPKITPVSLPAPVPPPEPVPAAPIPVRAAPIPAIDPTKSSDRVDDRKVKRMAAKIASEVKRMSKEEFDRLHKQQSAGAKSAALSPHSARVPRIDARGIASGVVGGSTANRIGGAGGKALTRAEQSLLDSYIAFLRQQLRNAFEETKPAGLSDRLVAVVEVRILSDGTLTNGRIIRTSGSDEFDRAALDAIARVPPIGARPEGLAEVQQIPFRMLDDDSQ